MKIQDIKIGQVYKTATENECWHKGDYFKAIDVIGTHWGPMVKADFNNQGFGQKVECEGMWALTESDIEGPVPDYRQSTATAEPEPNPTTGLVLPEWDRNAPVPPESAEHRMIGYLSALNPKLILDKDRANAAVVQFLNHIGYEEIAKLFERFQ